MTEIVCTVGRLRIEHDVDLSLGWRWWRRSLLDRGFQDEQCVSLGYVDLMPIGIEGSWVLVAREFDGALDLCSPFSLFPIFDEGKALPGAAEFGERIVALHAKQPVLL